MVELTRTFYPREGSALHRLDTRFKMVFLILLSIATIHAGFFGLFILFMTKAAAAILVQISIKRLIRELRYFFIFLCLIFVTRTLSTPGEKLFQIEVFSVMVLVTKQGLLSGVLVCFRLFLVVLLGYFFIWSTLPSQVRVAVAWFLKPVPLIPEKKVATMLSLLMRFLPLILQEAKETADAQRARFVENRKNPAYRFIKLAVPILRRIFLRADDLVLAMEARGYSENRTLPCLNSKKSDWLSLAFVISLSLMMTHI
jgi:energy-coupling factor transporter transmembrane protein EcfT